MPKEPPSDQERIYRAKEEFRQLSRGLGDPALIELIIEFCVFHPQPPKPKEHKPDA